ncbi:MAG: MFS transporter [Gammaproteobacteria bacterium]
MTGNTGSSVGASRVWGVVAASSIGCAAGLAALPFYGLSSFMMPLERVFGWTRSQIGLASTCLTIGIFVLVPYVGRACDRFGVRRVVLPSIVALAAALALLCFMGPHVWSLYAGYGLVAILGAGTTPVSYSAAVARWFTMQRGLALGVTLAGTGLAAFFAPRILTAVIAEHGWRAGWLVMAGLSLCAFPLAFWFLREPPQRRESCADPGAMHGMSLREALRSYRFWIIAGAFFAVSLGISGLIVNMIAMLEDAGLQATDAAHVASLIGIGVIAARLTIGYIVDRMFAPAVGTAVLLVTAAGCWLLATAGPGLAVWAAPLIGFAMGAEVDLIAYLISRYFGLRHFGVINGCGYAAYNAGAAFSPFLIGVLFAHTGTYTLALQITAGLCAFAGLSLLTLGAYPQRASLN